MNVEQNDAGYEQPKKSGKKWFACGGVGCILILLLCGGLIGAGFFFISPAFKAIEEARVLASEHQAVINALGEPMEFGAPQQQSQNNQAGEVSFGIPISGSKNTGTLIVTLKMAGFGKWETTGLTVEVDEGETIVVSGELSLDIDDGDLSAEEDTE